MNKVGGILIAVLLFLFSLTIQASSQQEAAEVPKDNQQIQRQIKHVVLITMDGLNCSQLNESFTPGLNGLAAQGIKTEAISVLPTNFPTFAASLLTGADPDIHGYYKSGNQVKTQVLPEIAIKYGRSAAYISKKGSLPAGLFPSKGNLSVKKYEIAKGDNKSLVNKAIEVFEKNQPYFLGIRLAADINPGSSKEDASRAVADMDAQIGRLLNTLMSYGVFNDSLIIAVGHFSVPQTLNSISNQKSNLMLPVIMAGPGLKAGVTLPPVRIVDIAPTAALLSGLQVSPESNGFVLWNALQSGNGFVEENLLIKRVNDLSKENASSVSTIYRLLEEKRLVNVEKENVNAEKSKIQKTISEKDKQIRSLKLKINLLKTAGAMMIVVLGSGYIIEYFFLRKRFLMF